ncbi:hypothetical protein GQ53DRAFT_759311 [Thozetella sp. PMI_491]|nr:hypothetical protein GQ53DRAFT_759311 [Thozetella sp. PMI_491]
MRLSLLVLAACLATSAVQAPCISNNGCESGRLVHCLLSESSEALKANMAAAAVLLGLLPTTLSLVGSNTVDTGVLALRRPLPAAMLAAGAPSVALMRMFDYDDPVEMMSKIPEGLSIPEFKGPMSTAVVAGEYILAAAAVANLGHLSYLLCIQAVCSFTSDTSYHPALRAFLTLALQAWGTFTVGIRLRVRDPVVDTDGLGAPNSWLVRSRTRFSRLLATEFQSSFCDLKGGPIELEPIVKSNLFIFFN